MDQLDDILREATAAIDDIYFQLPIDGGGARLFERNYCYELYTRCGTGGRATRGIRSTVKSTSDGIL